MSRQVAAKAEAFQKMNKREIFCFLFGLTSRSPRPTNLGRWHRRQRPRLGRFGGRRPFHGWEKFEPRFAWARASIPR